MNLKKVHFISLTQTTHEFINATVKLGDKAIDATCGNGHDTLFLAKAVGVCGCVWSFDIQESALFIARQRLIEANVLKRVHLICDSHERMEHHIMPESRVGIRVIVFNLGYLPGGNKQITTKVASTLKALKISWQLLERSGLLAVVLYPGHAEGLLETQSVLQAVERLQLQPSRVEHVKTPSEKGPQGLYIWK